MANRILQGPRIRVLINGLHSKTGGGVTYLRNLVPELAKLGGLELHVLLHENQYAQFRELGEAARIHLLEIKTGLVPLIIWEQVVLPILSRMMSCDVVFSPANYGPLLAPAQMIILHNSWAVSAREPRFSRKLYWLGLRAMTFLSLLTAQRSIAVSEYAARTLGSKTIGLFRGPPAVIHHGLSPIFAPDPSGGARENFLLAVSDIYIQKNTLSLIEALARVRAAIPNITLKIAGRVVDEEYADEVRSLIVKHRLEGAVEFLGWRAAEDLVDLYRRCALFVFPSTEETFGMPLAEAMACGTPIASSSAAAMPEIVADAALMFDPHDIDDMAEKILRLLSDQPLRQVLGERAIRRAAAFSWETAARQTAAVLREIGGGRLIERSVPT